MNHYEILMNSGEKLRVDMTDSSPCLIKQFLQSVNAPGDNIMVFDEILAVRVSDISAVRKQVISQ